MMGLASNSVSPPEDSSSSANVEYMSASALSRKGSSESVRRNLNSYLMQNQASSSSLVAATPTSSRKRKRTPSSIQALMPQLNMTNGDGTNIITPSTRSEYQRRTTQTRLPFQSQRAEEDSIGSFESDSESIGESSPTAPRMTSPFSESSSTVRQTPQRPWIYYNSNRNRASRPADFENATEPNTTSENEPSPRTTTRNEATTSRHESSSVSSPAAANTPIRANPCGILTNVHHHSGGRTEPPAISQQTDSALAEKGTPAHNQGAPQTNQPQIMNHSEGAIKLNAKQARAVQAIKDKKNVFLTGPAGTGKSVVLKQVLKYCSTAYQSNEWVAVAPTGITAIAIGGQTIHSFAGIGVPYTQQDFQRAWEKERREAWRRLKIMVIEEVSMIAGEFLDRLDSVVRQIRKVDAPFGGIQLMICGDFLQLPPIAESPAKMRAMRESGEDPEKIHGNRGFAFQSYFWNEANLETIHLTEVFRQDNPQFVKVLSQIRRGLVNHDANTFLASCNRPLTLPHKDIEPTRLYCKNADVDQENMIKLNRLDGEIREYTAVDRVIPVDPTKPGMEEKLWNSDFFRHTIAEDHLRLKVGAQVMLIKNDYVNRGTVVNGSRGVVVGFTSEKPQAPFDLPITIPFSNSHRREKKDMYPEVKFQNGETRIIGKAEFGSRIVGVGECVRYAVPLKLAWAITVHKSQGMTLDYVTTDLSGIFCEAQAYVALSRAKDEKCLELRNFSPRVVKANRRALAFYDNPNAEIPNWDHREKWSRPKVKVEGVENEGQEEEAASEKNKKTWV